MVKHQPQRIIAHLLRGVGRAFVLCCLMIGLLANARAEFKYEPSACKTDAHGKLYVALGWYVFAVPSTSVPFVGEIYDGMQRLAPPDPSEQVGCPLNPRQVESHAFGYAHLLADNDAPGRIVDVRSGALLVQLIRTNLSSAPPSPTDSPWMGETGRLKLTEEVCDKATRKDALSNGIIACRYDLGRKDLRVEDWLTVYRSSPDVYGTPLRKPFVVNCGNMSFTLGGECNVGYLILPELGLTYRFAVARGTTVQLNEIIDFDRGLRSLVKAMLIDPYNWPAGGQDRTNGSQQ